MDDDLTPDLRAHLQGIVAIWLTTGQQPVDGPNDTRYDFFDGDYEAAHDATRELIEAGLVLWAENFRVVPTAKGVFVAMGGQPA